MLRMIACAAALALALAFPAAAEDATAPDAAPRVETAAAATGVADDIPQAVKDAFKGDYEKHCSAHEPGSSAAKECMAESFGKLSDGCVTAILDSPLVEQHQQDVAAAMEGDIAATEDAKPAATAVATAKVKRAAHGVRSAHKTKKARAAHKTHGRTTAHKVRYAAAKPHKRFAKAKHATLKKYAARKGQRHYAHAGGGMKRRSVAANIRRGTNIAGYYVKKYTRFATARAFR